MQSFVFIRTASLLLALGASTLVSCRKDEVNSLEGPLPTASFTYTLDTSEYPVKVTFTNTSTDGFLYQWDFGDGSPLESGQNVTHVYTLPRTYQVRLVVAGRGGTGNYSDPEGVVIPSICDNTAFSALTSCSNGGTGSWTFSDQPGAIVKLAADGTTVLSSSSAPLSECQEDDLFTFTNSFTYTYDGGLTCTPGVLYKNASAFTFRTNGSLGQLTLTTPNTFIGLADTSRSRTYDIIEAVPSVAATATTPAVDGRLRLRTSNADGTFTVITLVPPLPPLVRAERLLTGGSSRTWVLDNAKAAAITVGTEAAPTTYFAGGAANSLPACQADDEYTFTTARNFIYDAKAETFTGGDPEPVKYACVAPRSLTTTYTFGAASGAGLAQFTLADRTPNHPFIGATDASPSRVYRILSINSREMILRGGTATSDPVFTIKLRVK